MLDINIIRENSEGVKQALAKKNVGGVLVDKFLEKDGMWRTLTKEIDDLRAEQKRAGEEKNIERAKELKTEIQEREKHLVVIEGERIHLLRSFPNLPLEEVTVGKNDKENVVLREVGERRVFSFQPKDYLTLAEALHIIDVERAAKVSGSRFGYLKGGAALLEFALVHYAIETVMRHGFIPVVPPVLIKSEMMEGMGYVDSEADKEERYYLEKDSSYLVGTSEQSMGPMHAGEVFQELELPRRYAGFSTCFRREAGSYGKDTKGILRVHQFDKVEMFSFCKPEDSRSEHKLLLQIEEELMRGLQLPYRVIELCTGDLSQPSATTFDIEAWMPGQNGGQGEYRETHSTSNTTDYQARRLNVKYHKPQATSHKPQADFVHMLNGTAFAIGRMIIAILENYQQEDGTVLVPEVLQKYMNGLNIIKQ